MSTADRATTTDVPERRPLDRSRLDSRVVGSEASDGDGAGVGFFRAIEVVERTGSTNVDLAARAARGGGDRTVLFAEDQTGGRGRLTRSFSGVPYAQVIVSIAVEVPGVDLGDLGWVPLVAGIATVDAVRAVTGVPAVLKWPNDVLVDDRKLAGILSEVATTDPEPTVVVGIGLNVDLTADELPVPTASSLRLEAGGSVDRTGVAVALLDAFARVWRTWSASGWAPSAIADAYRERCSTIGRDVRVILPGGDEFTGIAEKVDERGRLVVRAAEGRPVALSAGDVTHVRPI